MGGGVACGEAAGFGGGVGVKKEGGQEVSREAMKGKEEYKK